MDRSHARNREIGARFSLTLAGMSRRADLDN